MTVGAAHNVRDRHIQLHRLKYLGERGVKHLTAEIAEVFVVQMFLRAYSTYDANQYLKQCVKVTMHFWE